MVLSYAPRRVQCPRYGIRTESAWATVGSIVERVIGAASTRNA